MQSEHLYETLSKKSRITTILRKTQKKQWVSLEMLKTAFKYLEESEFPLRKNVLPVFSPEMQIQTVTLILNIYT